MNLKKLLIPNLPYAVIGLYATKLSEAWRLTPGVDFSEKLLNIGNGFAQAFAVPLPSFHPTDLCIGLMLGAVLRLAVHLKGKNAKKYRKNTEYGSARWGTAQDIQPYIDPVFENNIILTQTERLMMSGRSKNPANARNKNVLIVGGSGSGKTRFWIKPNLMQCTSEKYPCSFVVTDPKGSIVVECGKLLQHKGYRIKILNTINFSRSMHYNPFAYIHSEKDILKLVTALIANTKGEGKSGEDFWVKCETLLYTALIGYLHYVAPPEEQNFATLVDFINAMETRENEEDFQNPVDLMFDALAKKDPQHFAVRQYKKYKLAAGSAHNYELEHLTMDCMEELYRVIILSELGRDYWNLISEYRNKINECKTGRRQHKLLLKLKYQLNQDFYDFQKIDEELPVDKKLERADKVMRSNTYTKHSICYGIHTYEQFINMPRQSWMHIRSNYAEAANDLDRKLEISDSLDSVYKRSS